MNSRGPRGKSRRARMFVVMTIPESGLFIKNGMLVTGKGKEIHASELLLFDRYSDAVEVSDQSLRYMKAENKTEDTWSFPVIPVLVSRRDA